jgi:pyruvate kinase
MANALGAPAIIVMTHTGRIARSLSRLRPTMPIIAMTDSEIVQRSLQLSYAVHALHIPFEEDPEATIDAALLAAQKNGWIAPGQKVVLVTDLRTHGETVSTVHARQV